GVRSTIAFEPHQQFALDRSRDRGKGRAVLVGIDPGAIGTLALLDPAATLLRLETGRWRSESQQESEHHVGGKGGHRGASVGYAPSFARSRRGGVGESLPRLTPPCCGLNLSAIAPGPSSWAGPGSTYRNAGRARRLRSAACTAGRPPPRQKRARFPRRHRTPACVARPSAGSPRRTSPRSGGSG